MSMVRVIAIQEAYVGGRRLKIGEPFALLLLDGQELPRWAVLDAPRFYPGCNAHRNDLPRERQRAAAPAVDEHEPLEELE